MHVPGKQIPTGTQRHVEGDSISSHLCNEVLDPYNHAGHANTTGVWLWHNNELNVWCKLAVNQTAKQAAIHKNNQAENNKIIHHKYKVNNTVLVKNKQSTQFGQDMYNGPWKVLEVRNNGTVKIEKGAITDIYNIHNVTPYK